MHSLSSGRRVFELEPEDLWARALRSALGDCRSPVALEWGERDSSAGIRRRMVDLPGAGWLIDPDTHLSGLKGRSDFIHYKLHGWHPDRWVRRYGQRRAKELIGRIRKAGTGAMLVLSHSGRIEEFKVFSEAIEGTEG